MELKHLRSFVAVAEELSFVRAAGMLHLSQAALTEQIQKLEQELGVQLFLRDKRSVALTEPGAIFLTEARATLVRAQQAVERVQKAARGETGRLRIGFVSSAALEIVPGIALAFRHKFPDITLDLTNMRTSMQVKRLLAGTLDAGFVRLPLAQPQLLTTIVHREPFVLALPEDHRLAQSKSIQLGDFRDEKFVSYGRRWAPGFFDAMMQMCTREGFSPEIVQETGEMYTTMALVAAGVGVAILPRSVALAPSQGVAVKPLPKSVGTSEIAMAVRRSGWTALIEHFVETVDEVLREDNRMPNLVNR
ncbi:LysR family transcriptional regulator [Silvibacterium dinghuense]|uniref:LysR family transcriptional regulator n=1 Tax=Silvibacterium dinghuense TaxID=1560006 RepID=A0A4Q1SFV7_9BACT|nr:LysR family transcriptional regulator [Silvibacterium dinghuense]RXS96448.1 LysR family transcriptional regulator [Silvibacterium dinghuense]